MDITTKNSPLSIFYAACSWQTRSKLIHILYPTCGLGIFVQKMSLSILLRICKFKSWHYNKGWDSLNTLVTILYCKSFCFKVCKGFIDYTILLLVFEAIDFYELYRENLKTRQTLLFYNFINVNLPWCHTHKTTSMKN